MQQTGLRITSIASKLLCSLFNFEFTSVCDRGLERAFAKCGRLRCEWMGGLKGAINADGDMKNLLA